MNSDEYAGFCVFMAIIGVITLLATIFAVRVGAIALMLEGITWTIVTVYHFKPNAVLWFIQRGRRLLPKHLSTYSRRMKRKEGLSNISNTLVQITPRSYWDGYESKYY